MKLNLTPRNKEKTETREMAEILINLAIAPEREEIPDTITGIRDLIHKLKIIKPNRRGLTQQRAIWALQNLMAEIHTESTQNNVAQTG